MALKRWGLSPEDIGGKCHTRMYIRAARIAVVLREKELERGVNKHTHTHKETLDLSALAVSSQSRKDDGGIWGAI